MYSSEPLPHFVDDYLAYLHEVHPTTATFDGVHTYDDLVEDYSRSAIDTHLRELGSFGRRLDAISPDTLSASEKVERPMLESHIRGRLYDLEEIRTWERNPQIYVETLALSLAAQALFAYAPPEERARRVLSKLRQVPRVILAARTNVKEPAGIFVKTALETLKGVQGFIDRDLPRAFAAVDDLSILGDLADASTEASGAVAEYAKYLEEEVAPKARGSFRLGREKFEAKLKFEEGIDLPSDKLLAIGLRELAATQEEFKRVAAKIEKGDPVEVWRRVKQDHPAPGALVQTAQAQVDELAKFIQRHGIVTMPDCEPLVVGPTPQFYRWTFASLWTPGAFESKPLRSYYYLTDVDPAWPAERQEEHLRDFSTAVLWSISIHEAYPGHFLHLQRVRQVESKLRKSTLFAPMSLVEGWAHYAEQVMFEEGFARRDPARRLGQLAEALIRLARLVVGIRLHTEDLSVEQGVRFFRDEAYLEESAARREAERGTFDPSYVVYALGKLMLLKLRADVQDAQGDAFSIKHFHDRVVGGGFAPFWMLRRWFLGDQAKGPQIA
jgi:uncharacterized protein (DUF885 family)